MNLAGKGWQQRKLARRLRWRLDQCGSDWSDWLYQCDCFFINLIGFHKFHRFHFSICMIDFVNINDLVILIWSIRSIRSIPTLYSIDPFNYFNQSSIKFQPDQFDSSDQLIEPIDLIVLNDLVNIIVLKVNLKLDAYNIYSYLIRRNIYWWTRRYPIQFGNNLPMQCNAMAADLNQMCTALSYVITWGNEKW